MKQAIFFAALGISMFGYSCSTTRNTKPVYPTNCANSLAGSNYTGSDICPSSSPSSYPCTILAIPAGISISNLYGVPVTAQLNCTNNSITIPAQTFSGNFSISGTGTYTATTIIINWNSTSGGTPMSCTTTYTR